MKMQEMFRATLMLLAASLLAAKALAIPLVTDVTFVIPPPYYATGAETLPGNNDNVAAINGFGGVFAGDPWTLLDKSDSAGPGAAFNNVQFELTATAIPGAPSNDYTWALAWSGAGLPLYTDFVFVTKGSNTGAAYYFDDVYFPTTDLSGDGTFLITYTNNGGQIPDLSHASVYSRLTDPFDPPCDPYPCGPTDPPDPPPGVPVPGTLFLFGAGLLALVRIRSRRR